MTSKHQFVPNVSISYVAHHILRGKKYVSSLDDAEMSFSVFGTDHTFEQLKLGTGLTYLFNDAFKINAWYDVELGGKRQEQEISLKLTYQF